MQDIEAIEKRLWTSAELPAMKRTTVSCIIYCEQEVHYVSERFNQERDREAAGKSS